MSVFLSPQQLYPSVLSSAAANSSVSSMKVHTYACVGFVFSHKYSDTSVHEINFFHDFGKDDHGCVCHSM